VGITEQRVTLPVIIVQVGLMEHLRIHVSHQHVRDEVRADVIENLRGGVSVIGRLNWIGIDARTLRWIIIPVSGVEEDIIGTPRYFIKAWGIAVHDAYIR